MSDTLDWREYDLSEDPTVAGDVRVSSSLYSERLDRETELLAYLPPSYDTADREYPVVYMHDGKNLFDDRISYSGEWQVDETMETLAEEGIEAIVVGIPNADDDRGGEYSPVEPTGAGVEDAPYDPDELPGGDADEYLAFLAERVVPAVEDSFRTKTGREYRGLAGSSLGGLVSLYGYFEYPDLFGFAGVLSPAFWWTEGQIFEYVAEQSHVPGRLYLDVGGDEMPDSPDLSARYREEAREMVEQLEAMGYDDSELRFVLEEGAVHQEAAWARRFPDAARFLLGE
ncbi:Predicted hydrolase of the alpha/beta superfamily [Natronoarchaeum philippinense]|uniref:Predicted hydrolase of the alpha/beta superfamily n=1 Tax=Natronoarchaeum philippinense TaxID=558529 RepID=A0A285P7J4_NATPI|nr:alpha/beta hydrolase-fold protein [Natronoarchaeum philippinense]SNZ16106.1 Predicted hydrolase of the alpha/beta superfamily [Natronoarchaeum philippinense]